MSGLTVGIDSLMFKLLSGILSKNGDRKDRSLVRGRSARHPWSLVRLLGRYDAATTTIDNVRHWEAADGLSASASNNPDVRRTLRNRSRYEIANNSYARGISLTLANDCVGTGPRLQMRLPTASLKKSSLHGPMRLVWPRNYARCGWREYPMVNLLAC